MVGCCSTERIGGAIALAPREEIAGAVLRFGNA
jgi:hypothetical protein